VLDALVDVSIVSLVVEESLGEGDFENGRRNIDFNFGFDILCGIVGDSVLRVSCGS
jgi:hypothetical protein